MDIVYQWLKDVMEKMIVKTDLMKNIADWLSRMKSIIRESLNVRIRQLIAKDILNKFFLFFIICLQIFQGLI